MHSYFVEGGGKELLFFLGEVAFCLFFEHLQDVDMVLGEVEIDGGIFTAGVLDFSETIEDLDHQGADVGVKISKGELSGLLGVGFG